MKMQRMETPVFYRFAGDDENRMNRGSEDIMLPESHTRYMMVEIFATLVATLVMNCVVVSQVNTVDPLETLSVLALALGAGGSYFIAYIIGPGSNVNTSFSIGFAAAGFEEWRFVPTRLLGQMIGGLLGHALTYGLMRNNPYLSPKNSKNTLYFGVPNAPEWMSHGTVFFSTFLWTFILMQALYYIFSLPRRKAYPTTLVTLICIVIACIKLASYSFAMQSNLAQYHIGCLFLAMAGWSGDDIQANNVWVIYLFAGPTGALVSGYTFRIYLWIMLGETIPPNSYHDRIQVNGRAQLASSRS